MRKIELEHGKIVELIKIFKLSRPTIRKALNFRKIGSENLAEKIRKAALTLGGVELSEEKNIKN